MTTELSANTKAILLLTAPLLIGQDKSSANPLTIGEYNHLARRLRNLRREPADLLRTDAREVLEDCSPTIDRDRLTALLDRGFLLSPAVERWQARSIWVTSRADAEYPERLKKRLAEHAPPVLYGCGDRTLLNTGGLAVVGSRKAGDEVIEYTESVGRLTAEAGCTLVSGGARGVDQAAMRGASDAGGSVVGILADGLEKAVMHREHRDALMNGRLVLISPYDPGIRFHVGHAMQRNKLIYALANAALIVNSDYGKGGTWTGAVEQLDKWRFIPIYVRAADGMKSLDALQKRGANPWPGPETSEDLKGILDAPPKKEAAPNQEPLPFDSPDEREPSEFRRQAEARSLTAASETHPKIDSNPADELFTKVRELLLAYTATPKTESEVAEQLAVQKPQARTWLNRLAVEGAVEKLSKPVRFRAIADSLFDQKSGT